ncbi:hypothetical protein Hanom_Chr08g00738681 [Helianthus anomalus]
MAKDILSKSINSPLKSRFGKLLLYISIYIPGRLHLGFRKIANSRNQMSRPCFNRVGWNPLYLKFTH